MAVFASSHPREPWLGDPRDLASGLHLSPREGGFAEASFESIWSW